MILRAADAHALACEHAGADAKWGDAHRPLVEYDADAEVG